MPLLLRKIRSTRWFGREEHAWLPDGEFQADALGDLNTEGNKLSVWEVEDDRSNFDDVVAGFAAARENLTNLDYALFDQRLLSDLNIKVVQTTGGTPSSSANTVHRELVELSATKRVDLAKAIQTTGVLDRLEIDDIGNLICQAVKSGQITREMLKEKLRAKVMNCFPRKTESASIVHIKSDNPGFFGGPKQTPDPSRESQRAVNHFEENKTPLGLPRI